MGELLLSSGNEGPIHEVEERGSGERVGKETQEEPGPGAVSAYKMSKSLN